MASATDLHQLDCGPATAPAATAPRATVVIPARNEAGTIGACLQALAVQTIGAAHLEVIVVAAGSDDTAAAAARHGEHFGRFEVATLAAGNKNAALQLGCARAHADMIVLLDADTELEPPALSELEQMLARNPRIVAHGAARPRLDTWVSRYWELNRRLHKDLHFDRTLSGEFVALPRAALPPAALPVLLPATIGSKDDLYLGRALQAEGWEITYAPRARATTMVPWTLGGLLATMLRNRRGAMAIVPLTAAARQAAASAVLLAALPAALVAARWSIALALACAAPLLAYAAACGWRIEALRRRGLGDYRRALPQYLLLDLVGRALKLWAFGERLRGRAAPRTFRGGRLDSLAVARER
ncbi:MAG: glycosyltransferase family 2 protein [Deltaproteobacteria bacterium]|nr:glycosyltransferase family 2 protein [Deltaproteobacteria bacterium]